jgi:hypothetical protein
MSWIPGWLLVILALGGPACSGVTAESNKAVLRGPVLSGRVYLILGDAADTTNIDTYDLYKLDFGDGSLVRLTKDQRIVMVAASQTAVVVSGSPGGLTRLYLLDDDGQLAEIPGLGNPRGSSPGLWGENLSYIEPFPDGREGVRAVRVYDLGRLDPPTSRYETGRQLRWAKPGPGNAMVVAEQVSDAPLASRFLLIDPDGSHTELGIDVQDDQVVWGANECVAMSDRIALSTLRDARSWARKPLPVAWVPLAWSPAGDQLLLSRGGSLGVLTDSGAGVDVVWSAPPGMKIANASWIDTDASERSGRARSSPSSPLLPQCNPAH